MMGVVSGFLGVSNYVKVAALVVMVAQILNWIAYCTSSWWVVTTPAAGVLYTHYGLWRACNSGFLPKCAVLDGTGSDNMAAAQTFANFGFVSLNLGCLLLGLYVMLDTCRGNREAGLGTGVTLLTSGVGWLIAVCVFAGSINQCVCLPAPSTRTTAPAPTASRLAWPS
ncbi:uncharacterized protein LOC131943498 [Physella acuta]|uniref:uncharacterized protein LOC131943498 n=1 Tax=Physella acuta TaxID=109671 RepID=UPI0027DC2727|nr:uncharacterized protein LOC131943498 [Physella acuta]